MKKQILLVGTEKDWAIERLYNKYLNESNELQSKIFDCSAYIDKSILTRIRNRIGDLSIYKNVNKELLSQCKKNLPDIVWVFKGVEIFPKTLQILKQQGIILVNYNPDHPFIRTIIAHGSKNILECVPLYNYHFCYSKELMEKIKTEYRIPCHFLPFGYELSNDEFESAQNQQEIIAPCFVGNYDSIRGKLVQYLTNNGMALDVYGHGWEKQRASETSTNTRYLGGVLTKDLYSTLRHYRLQLNIFRPHNEGSHNMRTFEIPAVGGIQLAPYSEEQADFFDDEKSIFFYKSKEECLEQVKKILAFNVPTAEKVRKLARSKSLNNGYSYKNRTQSIVNYFLEQKII